MGKELALDMPVRAFHGVFLHEKREMLDDLRTFLPADGHGKAGAERQHLLMDAGRLPAGEVIDAQYLSPGEQLLLYEPAVMPVLVPDVEAVADGKDVLTHIELHSALLQLPSKICAMGESEPTTRVLFLPVSELRAMSSARTNS